LLLLSVGRPQLLRLGAGHTALSVCWTSDLLSTFLLLFTLAANQVVGTRRLAASLSKTGMLRQASGGGSAAGPTNMQRRQEMLRNINTGDAVLLLGGDLNVTVVQAQVCGVCVGVGGSSQGASIARVWVQYSVVGWRAGCWMGGQPASQPSSQPVALHAIPLCCSPTL
jgi:hypothetical protein